MYRRTRLLAACLTTIALAGTAHAGVILRTTVENFAEDNAFFEAQESYVTITKVEGNRMRMDTQSMEGKVVQSAIFVGDTDTMYMIDHDDKVYMVLDREQMEKLGSQMSDAMKEMEAALAQMPEAQRAMMERMMKDKMPQADVEPPAPPVVTDMGESGSVNGVDCQWKKVTRDGALSEKVCVCDETAIAGGQEMVALAHEMKDFAEGMMKVAQSVSNLPMFGGGTMGSFAVAMTPDLGGFALISEHYDGDEELSRRSTFESSDGVSIPDEEFTPPSGYKRRSLDGIGR